MKTIIFVKFVFNRLYIRSSKAVMVTVVTFVQTFSGDGDTEVFLMGRATDQSS